MGLSFTTAAGSRQRSHSRVRVPWDSLPYFTVSDSRLPQLGGPGPRLYISQEQGVPVIAPSTGFSFHRLLRLTGLQWRYSTPPSTVLVISSRHGPHRQHHSSIISCVFVAAGTCLASCWSEKGLHDTVVYSPISRSLHSNGCTPYNTHIIERSEEGTPFTLKP
jgi:hypothetical protein